MTDWVVEESSDPTFNATYSEVLNTLTPTNVGYRRHRTIKNVDAYLSQHSNHNF